MNTLHAVAYPSLLPMFDLPGSYTVAIGNGAFKSPDQQIIKSINGL